MSRSPCHEAHRLARLISEHAPSVERLVQKLGVHGSDASDVTQRVFLTAARKLDRLECGSERAFLFAVAVREAGHQRRTYRRRREVAADDMDPAASSLRPDELLRRKQTQARAARALAAMGSELSTVFVLSELEGESSAQIAARLCVPVGTIKSRLRRARCLLKRELGRSEPGH